MPNIKEFLNQQSKYDKIKPNRAIKVACKIMKDGKIEDSYSIGVVYSITEYHTAFCKMISPFKEYFEAVYQFDALELVTP